MATQQTNGQRTEGKPADPGKEGSPVTTGQKAPAHEYDPVGMAGEKAGIVKEIEQDLKQEDTDQEEREPSNAPRK